MNYEDFLKLEAFGVSQAEKDKIFFDYLKSLTDYHAQKCLPYRQMLQAINFQTDAIKRVEDLPFLPVRLFKELELSSVGREEIFKTMTSSGTSGQQVSKIFLDRETAGNQQKTLAKIVENSNQPISNTKFSTFLPKKFYAKKKTN